jgi:hypothetical protein
MGVMGRKPGISRSEELFRVEIARVLKSVIGEERGAQARAARQLGISRQALSLYLARKATPGSAILGRACALWPPLSFSVGQITMDSSSFKAPKPESLPPTQLLLFDAISEIDSRQLEVEVLNRGVNSIDLKVSIDFGDAHRRARA